MTTTQPIAAPLSKRHEKDTMMTRQVTLSDRFQIAFWRSVMGALALGGGKAVPKGRVQEHRYGPAALETLDHWQPAHNVPMLPVVVHIHGGGWIAGSKGRFYTKPLMKLADAGHPVFSLNYPLAPEAPHPEPLRALLRGLAWIKQTQGNGGAVHLVGDSAGGNLAMMLAILLSNPQILRIYDEPDPAALPKVLSVTSIYGVLDRISLQEDGFPGAGLFLRSYAGAAAVRPDFSIPMPITPMDLPTFAHLTRAFIAAGGKDRLARSSRLFFDRAVTDFPDVCYKLYPGADHGFFNFGTGSQSFGRDLIAFLSGENPS